MTVTGINLLTGYTGYFTSNNEPGGIEMQPTIHYQKNRVLKLKYPAF
jgi:hypothetical protein